MNYPICPSVDHEEQHPLRHAKERAQRKKEEKAYERAQEKSLLPFHPAWLVGRRAVLVLVAVLVWTVFF
jgi:hypothetical protein